MSIEIVIEKDLGSNLQHNIETKDFNDENVTEDKEDKIARFKKILYSTRDHKVGILDIDVLLDREDKIRKYSRNLVFWFFVDKYLLEDNPDLGKDDIDLVKNIIKQEEDIVKQMIDDKFTCKPDLKMDILSRVEQYKWKNNNYGNSRKRNVKYIQF